MTVRGVLKALGMFAAGAAGGVGALAAVPRMTADVILDTVTDELRWPRTSVRVRLDTWEPGAETGRHEHPGPALLYVLEGELEEMRAEGTRTLRTGQAVWNRGRTPHNVRNGGDRVARVLAVHLEPTR
jgi:quercetin dioxygenase-like cupin family protein